jgi:hypothetical protein
MAEGHWEGCEGGMVHLHELFDPLSVLVQLHRSDAAYLAWHETHASDDANATNMPTVMPQCHKNEMKT